MTKAPLVFVIVCNFNGMDYLGSCLASLENQTYSNYEIVVFDNASSDNSVQFIQHKFPKVFLIESQVNLGFAEGNNLAIEFALNKKADYVFLVNNDTESEKDLIEKLVSTAEIDSSIGVIAPSIYDLQNRSNLQELGMAIDKFGFPLAIKMPSLRKRVFFVSGCAMLIKSSVLEVIGSFDKEYFMFAEDLDFCWRTQLAGYTIFVNENAKIFHASGGSLTGGVAKSSSYKTSSKRIFMREKNTIRTLIKDYGTFRMMVRVPFYVLLLLLEAFLWFSVFRPNTARKILQAIIWNVLVLPSTMRERAYVQMTRKVSDSEVANKMLSGYTKVCIFKLVGLPSFVS